MRIQKPSQRELGLKKSFTVQLSKCNFTYFLFTGKNWLLELFSGHIEDLFLTLIGMRGDTFMSLSFLDQILSAEFLSKNSKPFWKWKLPSLGLIWHPAKLIESYKKYTYEYFSCFHSSYRLGLSKTCKSQYANDEKATSQNILSNNGEYKGV